MSIGGQSFDIEYTSTDIEEIKKAKPAAKTLKTSIKHEIAPFDQVTAYINPKNCINCGTCREVCPANAISESQRVICHACPACTEKPGISPQEMEELAMTKSCTTGCPLHISPQGYVGLVKHGKYEEAFKLIWDKNPLPSVCGSVCHHPCEDFCKRGILVDSPIKIREIKKFLSDIGDVSDLKYQILYDEEIAVIGAGPAGLTAGHYLAKAGYKVTVFESASEAGGMLIRGIPEFRLKREIVEKDIARLRDAGLEIRTGARIDKRMLQEIREKYDVVIVATGAPYSRELTIPGFRLAGVMGAMNFMEHVNNGMAVNRHLGQIFKFHDGEAVVIGGGSVAVDAARTAVRAGASKVTVVSLESGDDIPAHPWEISEAEEEGITFIGGYSPVEYMSTLFPELQGVKFAKVTEFGKDENGRIHFSVDNNQTLEVKADWVVVAAGQTASPFWKELSGDDIFFAGDIASNKCSVVDAMASGRKTAIKVDAALRGRMVKNPMDVRTLNLAPVEEKIFPYNRRKTVRPETPMLDAADRVHSFEEVEGTFTREQAVTEADTCLGCGYETVDPEKCIACGMCQKLCPKGDVITMVIKEKGENI